MPHESLNIRNLAKLPQALRVIFFRLWTVRAKRAADGSLEDLASVLMQIWDLPEDCYGLALPLLFVHLDPAAIPSPTEFDDILTRGGRHHEFNPIIAAKMALHMISRLLYVSKIPPAAYVDLWTRLYPWIVFDSIHWDYIPDDLRSSFLSAPIYLSASKIILAFGNNSSTSNVIRTSPGVRAILVKYWAALVRNDAVQTDAWHDMCSILVFLTEDGARAAKYLEEMADGVDSSQADLARLLNHRDIGPSAAVALGLVVARLQSHSGQQWITEALDGDLLGLILALGLTARPMRTSTPEDCFPLLKKLLRNIIPGYLVYHPVALRMKEHFPNAVSLAASPVFKKSAVFGLWKEFATLVEQNLTALDLFESEQYISSKVCENVKNARRSTGVHDIENGAPSLHRPVRDQSSHFCPRLTPTSYRLPGPCQPSGPILPACTSAAPLSARTQAGDIGPAG
ncbi:hypothetical protein B0H14DRAFT_2568884 [Mycena olivaceomarginata]|nr:hypothetical protein B0H14DRAFT_2568884 [Mycena olivaceomarginata]